ncbi:MAG: hypothetical protein ACR2NM_09070 [Bythopirellula sp.]
MSIDPQRYPELTPDLERGLSPRALKYFGAGAIVACVTIGSGETVFASRGGAIFGYAMIWCFVLGALCKAMLIYSGARFITLTGCSPLQSWAQLPGLRGWFVPIVAVLTCLCMPLWLAGLPGMLGDFSNWVVGIQDPSTAVGFSDLPIAEQQAQMVQYQIYGRYWGTFYVLVALGITWLQSYGFLETVQTLIVALLLICMVIAAIVSQIDWGAMFVGLVPSLPDYQPWVKQNYPELTQRSPWIEIMVYLGVIGGGAHDYFGYLGMLREKAWGLLGRGDATEPIESLTLATDAENIRRGRRWLLPPQIDVTMATMAILLFTCCFVILGANVLHTNQTIPNGFTLLTDQAKFLDVLVGGETRVNDDRTTLQWLIGWVYNTGIFFAFFGTILGACEIYVRTVRECLVAIYPALIHYPLKTFRRWVLLVAGGGGIGLMWAFMKLEARLFVEPASLIGSGLVCGLWCFAMLYSERYHLPAKLRMAKATRLAVFCAGVVLTLGPLIGLVGYVQYVFGIEPSHSM